MSYIVSTIDITIRIPKKMRGIFPNEKPILIELKKEVPAEVPDYVAKYFIKSRPHVYRYASEPKPEPIVEVSTRPKDAFDPLKFLEENYTNIEDALKTLNEDDLHNVAKTIKLTHFWKQKPDRIIERIVHDIKVKEDQKQEIIKSKGSR